MNKNSMYVSLLALAVSAGAVVMATKKCDTAAATSTSAVSEKEIATMLEKNPQMIIDALQKYEQQQREAEEKEAAKLFLENIDELHNDPLSPYVGPKDAKVVLVEFFDFSCGFCKRIADAMDTVVKNNPDVKVVFKPITFVAPISKYAAQAAVAAGNQGKFFEVYKALLKAPGGLDEAKINAIVEKEGVDMNKFKADVNSDLVLKVISDVASLGNKTRVSGVPTLVLNGKKLNTIDAEGIQAEINAVK